MSRRRRAEVRKVLPDPKFSDVTVTKFMNYVMYEGKKAVAENIMYGAFDILEAKRRDLGPLETFHAALANVEFTHDALESALRKSAESLGIKAGQMFEPLRVAVCGRKTAPPLFGTLEALGREASLKRIAQAIEKLPGGAA